MEPFVGEIRVFAGNYAPVNWAFCNGQLLLISENDALFSLISTTYGGNGTTTFALPNLQGRVSIGQGNNYAMGQSVGTENVTLTVNELPTHTHAVSSSDQVGTLANPSNAVWAKSSLSQYANTTPNTQMNAQAISMDGGNQPHGNMMPTLTVSYIIALQGIYPTRN